jgi:uncharacterized membrane protein YhaH (DUF805 family)
MHYYLDVLKKYCVFSGRASRSEFWFFVLFNVVISLIFNALVFACSDSSGMTMLFTSLSYIYSLAVLLPGIGVSVRRLHDIGKGGGWFCISFIPIIGWIWAIVLYATPTEPGENRFGANPNSVPEF